MEASDSGQEQEPAPEQSLDLSPSSRGRQRKKNPKFLDYEVSDVLEFQTPQNKRSRKSAAERPASQRSPNNKQENSEHETEEEQQSKEKLPKKTPKKRSRKLKKTPGSKTSTADGPVADGAAQDEAPKPKRKCTKKTLAKETATATSCDGNSAQTQTQTEELTLGGRPKRGAAKAALKYLQSLAKEVLDRPNDESGSQPESNGDREGPAVSNKNTPKGKRGARGRKRKLCEFKSDPEEDEDFVPNNEDEEEEQLEDEEEETLEDLDFSFGKGPRTPSLQRNSFGNLKVNGLTAGTLNSIRVSTETNKKHREQHLSVQVFPDWTPSASSWQLLPLSEGEGYVPEELESAVFTVSREGLSKEDSPLQRLHRFGALPSHPERWDMLLFAGGPVWALEWCPTPDGAPARQILALACHRGMDEQHRVNQTYEGSGLIQLWDLGLLQYDSRPDAEPALVYALAQDKGFVWELKWCPAGAWDRPDCNKKAPDLPRLGLLAVATSLGLVTIYSLPHPDALLCTVSEAEKSSLPPIFKAKAVLTLKLGSFKAPRLTQSGQVLSLDWLPQKPHDLIAIGFYDGNVGLWDLNTKSSLLRVREPDGSMSVLPYQCFLAHDNAVRALCFCPASRNLLVTAGEDRFIKTWDLTRLYEPITVQKRCLTTEVSWPLNGSGLLVAEETAYAAYSSHGLHYYDHYMQTFFAVPRSGTMWSMGYSDWLNFAATSDTVGEVVLSTLPLLSLQLQHCKRTIERRFPVYFSSLVPFTPTREKEAAAQEASAEGDEERTVEGETEGQENAAEMLEQVKYRDAVKKYFLQLTDFDLCNFSKFDKRVLWKQMKATEVKTSLRLDDFPLAALHKVRFSPNLSSHCWMAAAGQTGLVRLLCVRSAINNETKRMISQNQTRSGSESPAETGSEAGLTPETQPL